VTTSEPPDERAPVAPEPLRTRSRRGWYVYDWAASAFSTTVITVFLGPYLTGIAENAAGGADGRVTVLWLDVRPGSFFAYAVSLSVVLQVLVLPMVGAVADRSGRKLLLLGLFAYLGVAATLAMVLVTGSAYLLGGTLLVVANVAFGASTVVYNAYLPEVATPDERDAVSSRGWALGYLGGGLLLTVNLGLFLSRDSVGLSSGDAARICLASAALWWGVFALVPLRRLRRVPYPSTRPGPAGDGPSAARSMLGGFGQLRSTFAAMRELPQTLLFLVAYLFYNDGVQTVIALASVFGAEELGMSETVLIVAVLEVQLVAFVGALALGRLAGRFGARRVVAGSLVVWVLVLLVAYRLPADRVGLFLALAAAIGLVLGGTQALSRSLYSQVIPRSSEAEYFSFYELSDRGTSWLGPLVFGVVFDVTASYRNALVVLVVFFVVGLVLLLRVRVREAVTAAGNPQPRLV
jgi:MFS transporter, UMF1 family